MKAGKQEKLGSHMFTSVRTLVRSLIIVSFSILLFQSNAFASGQGDGKKRDGENLHAQKCVRCHDDKVYKRKSRRMKSYKLLESQVRRCNVPAKANFDNDQITAVTDYLNNRYYKFDPLK